MIFSFFKVTFIQVLLIMGSGSGTQKGLHNKHIYPLSQLVAPILSCLFYLDNIAFLSYMCLSLW